MVNSGILPLTFVNEADYDGISLGDELTLPNVKEELMAGSIITVKNETTGKTFQTECVVSDRQKGALLAGGTLNYTKKMNA